MNKTLKTVSYFAQLLLGIALSAFAMACFALPYDMVVAGVSGIGKIIHASWGGVSVSLAVMVVNTLFFLLGLFILGKKFAASILIGSFAFPFFLEVFQKIEQLHHLVNDPLLAAICAGIIDGVGLGLVIRIGGSSGGIDIPPIILNRKLGWKVAPVIYAIDFTIFAFQIPFTSSNGVILGILYALIYSVVMDKVLVVGQGGVQLMIFSDMYEEINEKLLKMGYGTTLIKARGGYIQTDREVVFSVVGNRRLHAVKNAVLAIDPTAFITISNINEVNGNGFTEYFSDEEYVKSVEDREVGLPVED